MNKHVDLRDLTDTETRILNATVDVILKFGPRKTTMNDIAEAAGLTRQTVYACFGGKDAVLAEMVRFIGRRRLTQIRVAWEYCPTLTEKLQAFARIVVFEDHDEMTGDDPQEMVSAYNDTGRVAYEEICAGYADIWAEELATSSDALERSGATAARLARFIVAVSLSLKRSEADKGRLHEQLSVLNAAVLAMTGRR